MLSAPVCWLSPSGRGQPQDCCDNPALFELDIEDEKGRIQTVRVCEAHHKRAQKGSEKWDGPLNRVGQELVAVTPRLSLEAFERIKGACRPGQKPTAKVVEILETWSPAA